MTKCVDALVPVKCDHIPCGYYRISLDGQELGDWSELGVLSSLQQEFYRRRLLRSLAEAAVSG
ncbi:hypothetical protein WKK05_37295 (plasmid) [Nostoc sp. UHCC 0302]|uniref:hypothetical protein n=1 Tax=Nostoc sp. UHCC 0302 TaxID=3134896 RepID=UPI00311C9890